MVEKTLRRKLKTEQYGPHRKTGVELECSGRIGSACSTCGTVVLLLLQTRW